MRNLDCKIRIILFWLPLYCVMSYFWTVFIIFRVEPLSVVIYPTRSCVVYPEVRGIHQLLTFPYLAVLQMEYLIYLFQDRRLQSNRMHTIHMPQHATTLGGAHSFNSTNLYLLLTRILEPGSSPRQRRRKGKNTSPLRGWKWTRILLIVLCWKQGWPEACRTGVDDGSDYSDSGAARRWTQVNPLSLQFLSLLGVYGCGMGGWTAIHNE